MSRDKQIEEMANTIALKAFEQAHLIDGDENLADIVATDLYAKGYRKIHDDNAIQCVCYALGCQAAEKIKVAVAAEVCAEIGKRFESLLKMLPADGVLTDAKTFIEAHWEFIEYSIVSAYDAELKKEIHGGWGMKSNREAKKRKYYRKCGVCGERHEQSDMIRTSNSPNGWICFDCHNTKHPEYDIDEW